MKKEKEKNYKDNVFSLINQDKYWGEFTEFEMDKLLDLASNSTYKEVKNYIDKTLNRSDFIFGLMRSDFLYYLNINDQSTVLDCGCGLGIHTFNAARIAGKVYSFDQSLKRCQFVAYRAQVENFDNVNVFHSDFSNLNFENKMFDFILMNGVVEWLGEINVHKNPRDDQIAVLKKMYEYLKQDGTLYVGIENRMSISYLKGYDHNGLRFTSYFPRFISDFITRIFKKHSYRTYTYTYGGYKKLFKDAGFSNFDIYIVLPGYNLPKYIVPFDNIPAIRFLLKTISKNKGLKGKVISFIAKYDFGVKLCRHLFFSYLIYAKK
jgi:ubiquinone/menaquinone biosynthesis C-methylase UbiE